MEGIRLSHMTKALMPREMSKGQHDNTKTPPKSSITQRLQTDVGRSDGVTTIIKPVWFSSFTGSTFSITRTVV